MNPWMVLSVAVAVGVFLAFGLAGIHNRLVQLKSHCDNSFAQIEVQLKRRHDLIPNLVECVRGHLTHERETLERVLAARNAAAAGLRHATQQPGNSDVLQTWLGAEGTLGRDLGRLAVMIENYPDLQASRSVADLTEQLTSTENRIAFARQAYNDWVTGFNSYRQTFPQCWFASLFGFTQDRPWLEFADAASLAMAPSVVLS